MSPRPIDVVAGRLEARGLLARRRGDVIDACCPSHDDRHASLRVDVGREDRVLVTCHCGCGLADVVAALDLRVADLHVPRATVHVEGKGTNHSSSFHVSGGSRDTHVDGGSRDGIYLVAKTRARCRVLGLEGLPSPPDLEAQSGFRCVIPGHDHEAKLLRPRDGFWRYRCDDGYGTVRGLAEVYASQRYGRGRSCGDHSDALGDTEVSRWAERLDHEAGLRDMADVAHVHIPADASPAAVAVAAGAILLLGLRDERWAGQPFTFTRRFAAAYVGMVERTAREGIGELRKVGWLRYAGRQGRAYLWTVARSEGADESVGVHFEPAQASPRLGRGACPLDEVGHERGVRDTQLRRDASSATGRFERAAGDAARGSDGGIGSGLDGHGASSGNEPDHTPQTGHDAADEGDLAARFEAAKRRKAAKLTAQERER